MSGEAFFAGAVAAADFIATRFRHLMAMPEDARPTAWLQLCAEAAQAGIAAADWPADYDEHFCRAALQNIGWLAADRLPDELAADLDDADEGARARALAVAEFVIGNVPPILPLPDAQQRWRELVDRSDLFPPGLCDEPAPLFTILAQAILIERHLTAGQRKH